MLEMGAGSGRVARAMATTAEKDDRDDKDEAAEDSSAEAEEKKAAAADEAEDEDEVPAKPAQKTAPKPAAKAAAKRVAGKGARGRPTAPAQQGSSLGKSMILFVVIIGGLAAGFAILGREEQQAGPAKPKWKAGDIADVEITLVKNDKQELACASAEEIGGKHCAFEGMNKPWSKGENADDKKVMRPYTTTDRVQFAAAGLWSEPVLAPDKIPATRFSVKCKLKVEGTLKSVAVRWESTGQWFPGNEWYAGSVSDCKIGP